MTTKSNIIAAGIITIIMLLLTSGVSSSEVVFTALEPITSGLRFPEDVAVSPEGTIYVVDGSRGQVLIYDKNGQPAGSISIQKPTSVAVNSNGYIYIGTNNDLSVKILDSAHNLIGSLGIGAGEFKLPRNIAIDKATGNIYVVDQLDHSIKVYTSNGIFISEINDYPNLPQDVTIINNEIYVIDHPLITDPTNPDGGTMHSARVVVFGNPVRSFGSYGLGEGQFIRPAGIASDTNGILYITDSLLGVILCFDKNGSYLGAIYNPSKPMITPMGIALGGDKRLFVASLYTPSVHIFGLEGYTNMDVSPSELSFTAQQGQSNPPPQTITITNSGTGILRYTVTSAETWIILNTSSGEVGPNVSGTISVGVNISGLSAGTYNGNITITGDSGALEVVAVTLEITPAPNLPVLTVTPQILDYTYTTGDPAPPLQTVSISLSNVSDTVTWTATPDSGWISIDPSTGSGNSDLSTIANVNVNPANLAPGTYTGNITLTAPGAVGSPANVVINLTVKSPPVLAITPQILDYAYTTGDPAPPLQTVSISLSNVSDTVTWTATPDSGWISIDPSTGSGNSDLSTIANVNVNPANLAPGTYTGNITLTAPGAVGSPANVVINLTVKNGGKIEVNCNIEKASFLIQGLVNFEGTGQAWTTTEVPDGTYTITYTPVTGYKTPSSETKEISTGSTITFEGNYISLAMSAEIIVSRGADSKNPPTIGIFNNSGTMLLSFAPFSGSKYNKSRYGVNLASGDIDGDGKVDIVAGLGAESKNLAEVAAFRADGTLIEGSDFIALSTLYGANVAVADFNGDGKAEIVVGAGSNSKNNSQVRVFTYNSGSISDTGINFNAFTVKGGVNIATGDVDGDGIPELITAAGAKNTNSPEVRVWKVDTSSLLWSIVDTGIKFVAFSGKYGANVTTGDLNGDGISEIIVSSGPDPDGGQNIIKAFNGDGTEFDLMITDSSKGYGLYIASADLDNDGVTEIVAGLGPSSKNPSTVKIYKADGTPFNTFNAFSSAYYGAIVSAGELGY